MNKLDFKKSLDCYHADFHEFRILDVPALHYLMIDGHGDPNTSKDFQDAIKALYPVAYKLKFASKQELNKDYVVMPLEGLWWVHLTNCALSCASLLLNCSLAKKLDLRQSLQMPFTLNHILIIPLDFFGFFEPAL